MKIALIAVALLASLSAAGCLGSATQEDIDTLEAEEGDEVGVSEEELVNLGGGLGFTCSGTLCSCEPDGEDVVTSCDGFPQACSALGRPVTCCGWRMGRRGLTYACAEGYTDLASLCYCGQEGNIW